MITFKDNTSKHFFLLPKSKDKTYTKFVKIKNERKKRKNTKWLTR